MEILLPLCETPSERGAGQPSEREINRPEQVNALTFASARPRAEANARDRRVLVALHAMGRACRCRGRR